MRKGGGHAKGSAFERDIAKKIVKAFRKKGIVQRDCWRSVLSGGHEMSFGDLVISERLLKLFPYAVECKFRKKVRWENFIIGNPKSEEIKWVRQALEGASKRSGLKPLLVIKANNCAIFVMYLKNNYLNTPTLIIDDISWKVSTWNAFLKEAVKGSNG